MSGKSSIILTADNEHWYEDCGEPLANDKNAISLEFNKRNIRIDNEDDEALYITITNPDSEIYKVMELLSDQTKSPLSGVVGNAFSEKQKKSLIYTVRHIIDHTRRSILTKKELSDEDIVKMIEEDFFH